MFRYCASPPYSVVMQWRRCYPSARSRAIQSVFLTSASISEFMSLSSMSYSRMYIYTVQCTLGTRETKHCRFHLTILPHQSKSRCIRHLVDCECIGSCWGSERFLWNTTFVAMLRSDHVAGRWTQIWPVLFWYLYQVESPPCSQCRSHQSPNPSPFDRSSPCLNSAMAPGAMHFCFGAWQQLPSLLSVPALPPPAQQRLRRKWKQIRNRWYSRLLHSMDSLPLSLTN